MNKRYLFLIAVLAFVFSASLHAQLTIGGLTAPATGALLDLNSPGGNKGGLLLSNVFIEKQDSIPAYFIGMDKLSDDALDAHKAKFKGAIIYNTNPATTVGIHVWNGKQWQPMDCLGEPATPGEITLSATAVTKEGVFAAYISPVPGAKRYEWKVPEGLEATHPDMSGIAIAIRGK
jgi:hypothetical protein